MILLLVFAFIAGIVTILSPCILPVLPIVLSGTIGGKSCPYGIVVGFISSFTFFTLFLTNLVKIFGISADSLRLVSVLVISFFGLSLIIPKFREYFELLFNRLAQFSPKKGVLDLAEV